MSDGEYRALGTQQHLGDLGVRAKIALAAVGQEQHAGSVLDARGSVATLDELFELGALFWFEVKRDLFAHPFSLPDTRQ
jgi:hypothetical protein